MSTGRVSSREADPATLSAVETNASAGSEIARLRIGLRERREVLGAQRADVEGGRARDDLDVLLGGAELERDLAARAATRTTSRSSRAGSTTTPSRATSASSGTRRPTSMSVARSSQPSADAAELNARQRLDRAPGRSDSADRLELSEQDVSLEGDLHDEYLRRKVEVIGRIEAVEKCAFVRNERR